MGCGRDLGRMQNIQESQTCVEEERALVSRRGEKIGSRWCRRGCRLTREPHLRTRRRRAWVEWVCTYCEGRIGWRPAVRTVCIRSTAVVLRDMSVGPV